MYCLITGGGMVNKGAQSMTFIVLNELRIRFPNDQIIMLVPDDSNFTSEETYQFEYRTVRIKSLFYLLGGVFRGIALLKKVDKKDAENLDRLMKESRLLIDISGYALGSNWADGIVRNYLCMLHLAHRYQVPSYVMPQSFGPFAWTFPKSILVNRYIKKVMKYPQVVFAREAEGLELLQNKYHLPNVKPSYDMVLMSNGVDSRNIFRNTWQPQNVAIASHAVALIPNIRLLDTCSKEQLLGYYYEIAKNLTERNKAIYVMFHSGEDKSLALELSNSLNVKGISNQFLSKDLNCIEYEMLVSKFEFIIASRYHSIVHAFRKGVPCIALGWAVKYQELLAELGQTKYAFDVRSVDCNALVDAIQTLCERWVREKRTIMERVQRIQKADLFSVLETEQTHV